MEPSRITDLLYEALHDIMTEVVGWNYNDEHGFAERARERLAMYDEQRRDSYSQRCVQAAMRQRRHAHELMKLAEQYDTLHPIPGGGRHIGHYDAKVALRDAIRWIHAAKIARAKERNAEEMAPIRRESNDYRVAAE